jgi:hypothetical protein
MLSHVDRIKADLLDLQHKLEHCTDNQLRTLIEDWIAAKQKLLAKHLEEENKEAGGASKNDS